MSGLMSVETKPCSMCGKTSFLVVSEDSFRDWRSGALVQDAFPSLNCGDRELLMTGTHPECWDVLWEYTDFRKSK